MGEAKNYHGMARARFRGIKKVEMQFLMTAAALNLKKMVKIWDRKVAESSIGKVISDIGENLRCIPSIFRSNFVFNMP